MIPKPKTAKDFLALIAIGGGVLFPAIGFGLYFTGHGSLVVFDGIAIIVALLLALLFWLGLGFVGIVRMIGKSLIISGVVCVLFKPITGLELILLGVACNSATLLLTRRARQEGNGQENKGQRQ